MYTELGVVQRKVSVPCQLIHSLHNATRAGTQILVYPSEERPFIPYLIKTWSAEYLDFEFILWSLSALKDIQDALDRHDMYKYKFIIKYCPNLPAYLPHIGCSLPPSYPEMPC